MGDVFGGSLFGEETFGGQAIPATLGGGMEDGGHGISRGTLSPPMGFGRGTLGPPMGLSRAPETPNPAVSRSSETPNAGVSRSDTPAPGISRRG